MEKTHHPVFHGGRFLFTSNCWYHMTVPKVDPCNSLLSTWQKATTTIDGQGVGIAPPVHAVTQAECCSTYTVPLRERHWSMLRSPEYVFNMQESGTGSTWWTPKHWLHFYLNINSTGKQFPGLRAVTSPFNCWPFRLFEIDLKKAWTKE